jgi:hypothetical protein
MKLIYYRREVHGEASSGQDIVVGGCMRNEDNTANAVVLHQASPTQRFGRLHVSEAAVMIE